MFGITPVSRIRYMSDSDMDRVHQSTLKVLENVGILFHHEEAVEIFRKHGAKVDGKRVYIPKRLVEQAMDTVPAKVKLSGRDDRYSILLGDDYPNFYTNAGRHIVNVSDLDNGIRYAKYQDLVDMIKLMHASPAMDVCGGSPADPSDLPPRLKHLYIALANLKHTTKTLHTCVGYERPHVMEVVDMVEIAYGKERLENEHIYITSMTPLCPLAFDEIPLENGIRAAERNQVVNISPCAISGVIGPVTPYPGFIQQNIEFVAGMTLTQLVRPGAPVLYHACGGIGNMKNLSYIGGTPDMSLLNCPCNQMGVDFYKVPTRACAPFTEAKLVDCQAGYETMMNLLIAALSGASLIDTTHGGLYNMMTTSYEKIIIDEEMVLRVRKFIKGLDMSDHDEWIDVISEVGPGGTYVTDMSTITEYGNNFTPIVANWDSMDEWKQNGGEDVAMAANKEYKRRLSEAPESLLEPEIEKNLLKYIAKYE